MQDKLQEQLKKLLKSVIWDYHNNNLNQSEVKQEVLDYIFEGKGGDNKFFENYVDFIDQNFIGKEEITKVKNKLQEMLDRKIEEAESDSFWDMANGQDAKELRELLEQLK